MIVSFSVSNFRSFSSEETLSMVASKRLAGRHENHTIPIPDSDEHVLRAAILYGANGAGKSNLFRAMAHFVSLASRSRNSDASMGSDRFRFALSGNEESAFDLQFIAKNKLYRMGMTVDRDRIAEEWLVHVVRGKETVIYERITDGEGRVTVSAPGANKGGERLQAMATVGGPRNQSFLATVRTTLDRKEWGEHLQAVLDWFRNFQPISASAHHKTLGSALSAEPELQEFAGRFLREASTGVDHLEIRKNRISEDMFLSLLPQPVRPKVPEDLDHDTMALIRLDAGNELLVEKSGPDLHYFNLKSKAAHSAAGGENVCLELSDESDGTKRLLELVPMLHHLQKDGGVCIIDEIERSMHPNLVRKFLEFFLAGQPSTGQIISTTHQADLLDENLLRRDEIWFVEKDREGASRLYSLVDFKERDDHRIREHYLQGRFGAVPLLGALDRLPAGCSAK